MAATSIDLTGNTDHGGQVMLHLRSIDNDLDRVVAFSREQPRLDIGRASKDAARDMNSAKDNGWVHSPIVSREHARICLNQEDMRLYLEDRASTHGTYFNDKKLSQSYKPRLAAGDRITLGQTIHSGPHVYHPKTFEVGLRPYRPYDRTTPPWRTNKVELLSQKSSIPTPEDSPRRLDASRTYSVPNNDSESDEANFDRPNHIRDSSPTYRVKSPQASEVKVVGASETVKSKQIQTPPKDRPDISTTEDRVYSPGYKEGPFSLSHSGKPRNESESENEHEQDEDAGPEVWPISVSSHVSRLPQAVIPSHFPHVNLKQIDQEDSQISFPEETPAIIPSEGSHGLDARSSAYVPSSPALLLRDGDYATAGDFQDLNSQTRDFGSLSCLYDEQSVSDHDDYSVDYSESDSEMSELSSNETHSVLEDADIVLLDRSNFVLNGTELSQGDEEELASDGSELPGTSPSPSSRIGRSYFKANELEDESDDEEYKPSQSVPARDAGTPSSASNVLEPMDQPDEGDSTCSNVDQSSFLAHEPELDGSQNVEISAMMDASFDFSIRSESSQLQIPSRRSENIYATNFGGTNDGYRIEEEPSVEATIAAADTEKPVDHYSWRPKFLTRSIEVEHSSGPPTTNARFRTPAVQENQEAIQSGEVLDAKQLHHRTWDTIARRCAEKAWESVQGEQECQPVPKLQSNGLEMVSPRGWDWSENNNTTDAREAHLLSSATRDGGSSCCATGQSSPQGLFQPDLFLPTCSSTDMPYTGGDQLVDIRFGTLPSQVHDSSFNEPHQDILPARKITKVQISDIVNDDASDIATSSKNYGYPPLALPGLSRGFAPRKRKVGEMMFDEPQAPSSMNNETASDSRPPLRMASNSKLASNLNSATDTADSSDDILDAQPRSQKFDTVATEFSPHFDAEDVPNNNEVVADLIHTSENSNLSAFAEQLSPSVDSVTTDHAVADQQPAKRVKANDGSVVPIVGSGTEGSGSCRRWLKTFVGGAVAGAVTVLGAAAALLATVPPDVQEEAWKEF